MLRAGRHQALQVGVPLREAHGEHPEARGDIARCHRRHDQAHGVPAGRVAAVTCKNTDETTYTVRAKRWARGWELHIDGIGITQARTLNEAGAMATDYIALDTGADPGSFAVKIIPEVGHGLDAQTRRVRLEVAAAEQAQRRAAAHSRQVARNLKGIGLSGREIAAVLRVSPQRVSQLLKKGDSAATVSAAIRSGASKVAGRSGRGKVVSSGR